MGVAGAGGTPPGTGPAEEVAAAAFRAARVAADAAAAVELEFSSYIDSGVEAADSANIYSSEAAQPAPREESQDDGTAGSKGRVA